MKIGATSDINKVIRCDYGSDRLYSELSLQAIEIWKEWSNDSLKLLGKHLFHQTGVAILDTDLHMNGFQRESFNQLKKYGVIMEIANAAPGLIKIRNDFPGGYLNKVGGWGNSSQALVYCRHVLESKNVHFAIGKFDSFITNDKNVKGVRCKNGQKFYGNKVIMACGAWTPSLIKEMEGVLTATGQIVCLIQVPKSLIPKYSWPNFQVWFADITRTGFYGFPVNEEGVMKISIHSDGYLTLNDSLISIPRSDMMIPSEYISKFKLFIALYFPDLADLVELNFRWCHYTDSRDGDFYMCKSPTLDGLYYATGGTGHAFKFMPVLGDIMLDVIHGVKSDLTERFKWRVPLVETQKKLDGMRMLSSGTRSN
jgi:sarcosine oxidase/L-pipecolate oxidase